jgi:hypothetical protein
VMIAFFSFNSVFAAAETALVGHAISFPYIFWDWVCCSSMWSDHMLAPMSHGRYMYYVCLVLVWLIHVCLCP